MRKPNPIMVLLFIHNFQFKNKPKHANLDRCKVIVLSLLFLGKLDHNKMTYALRIVPCQQSRFDLSYLLSRKIEGDSVRRVFAQQILFILLMPFLELYFCCCCHKAVDRLSSLSNFLQRTLIAASNIFIKCLISSKTKLCSHFPGFFLIFRYFQQVPYENGQHNFISADWPGHHLRGIQFSDNGRRVFFSVLVSLETKEIFFFHWCSHIKR